jgi:type I restriction-modification system DNA methylase subunit
LRPDDEEGWHRASLGLERALPPLVHALDLLLSSAEREYVDVLGLVYMGLGAHDKRFGQFFTHPNIAAFMAEALIGAAESPPRRIIDPACGSGVMLLAYAGAVARRWPELIARNEIEFIGIDSDEVCASMARLNLLLHGLGVPGGKPDRGKVMGTLQALLPPEEQQD